MANTYDVGDKVRITATFKNTAGTDTDPTTIVGKYLDPSGSETIASTTNSATGIYFFDISISAEGTWFFRFTGTGTIEAAGEGRFHARDSKFS